jgi:hypothetical protein
MKRPSGHGFIAAIDDDRYDLTALPRALPVHGEGWMKQTFVGLCGSRVGEKLPQ